MATVYLGYLFQMKKLDIDKNGHQKTYIVSTIIGDMVGIYCQETGDGIKTTSETLGSNYKYMGGSSWVIPSFYKGDMIQYSRPPSKPYIVATVFLKPTDEENMQIHYKLKPPDNAYFWDYAKYSFPEISEDDAHRFEKISTERNYLI